MTSKNQHVLVVDSDRPSGEALATYLTKIGYNVATAANEEEAVIKALAEATKSSNDFDLILVDASLIEVLGVNLLRYLHPKTGIVAISSKVICSEFLNMGVSFLEKPLQVNRLLAAMSSAMLSRSHC